MNTNSNTAIVSPAQLKKFADFLDGSVKSLRSQGKKMRDSTAAARAVWKDAKYDAFQKQLGACVESLERFNKTGAKYAEFLREKAALADKYLKRR